MTKLFNNFLISGRAIATAAIGLFSPTDEIAVPAVNSGFYGRVDGPDLADVSRRPASDSVDAGGDREPVNEK